MMTKEQLRKIYRQKRATLTTGDINRMDDLLLIRFQEAGLAAPGTVLSYFPHTGNNEPNTHQVTDYLAFINPDLRLCYPVSNGTDLSMQAFYVDADTTYEVSRYGIPEPVAAEPARPFDLDMIIVPMLTFDQKNYRVGYGKGYYDRFLAQCRKDVLKVGLCYFEPTPVIEDLNEYDVPLDICFTPNMIYEL